MRNLLIVVSTCTAIGLAASAAYGDVNRPINGKHGIGEIASTCGKSGGGFWATGDGAYGCLKGNCDGKGGECNVKCDQNGKCTGSTPTITTGKQVSPHVNVGAVLTGTGSKVTGTKVSQPPTAGKLKAVSTQSANTGPSTGPIVRDHRTTPIVRDHRDNKTRSEGNSSRH